MLNKKLSVLVVLLAGILGVGVWMRFDGGRIGEEENVGVGVADKKDREVILEGLKIPWEVVFLPGGEMLMTEREGNLLKIGKDRQKIPVRGVEHIGEGGLLGMALHPSFPENRFVYLYLTGSKDGKLENRVERYKLTNDELLEKTTIIGGIRASRNHDGGRIAFGPDSYLYIGTGDAETPQSAEDTSSLNGKILCVKDDGSIPSDNPFGNAVWSYGHRNVQGLAWDDSGQLWATEHGPSGVQSGFDEINKIEKGKNYGWPDKSDKQKAGTVLPVINSGEVAWAPSGATFYSGRLFFTGLRGEALYEYDIKTGELKEYFKGVYGRLRTVTIGPDGFFYVLTNNTDGRGNPKAGDDKLIKISPKMFE